jgi:hypothetical protein
MSFGMRAPRIAAVSIASFSMLACQLPTGGTPVFVDMRAGEFWNGKAKLLEVSDDERRCYVAVRDRSLVVRKRWVDCAHVHATSARTNPSPQRSFR